MKCCPSQYRCPMEATLDLIGGKYKALALWHMQAGALRFSYLQRLMPGVTPKMLTQQLRDLERDGLISRTVFPVVPPHVEYSLTPLGQTIVPVLTAMCDWGKLFLQTAGESKN